MGVARLTGPKQNALPEALLQHLTCLLPGAHAGG